MQKFLKDTISNRYVKALLADTFVPRYPSIIEGDYIVKGIRYIFKSNIIECTKNGALGYDGKYKFVATYDRTRVDRLISDNFVSKESYYNSATHKRLGEFLRYYRGQTGIDLMPLYNCFDDTYVSNFSIYKEGILPVNNPLYKIAQVPIKFNKNYTIAIDCSSSIMLAPAFLDKGDYVFVGSANLTTLLYANTEVSVQHSTTFSNPISYRLDNTDTFLQKYEKYLYLLIQLPVNCNSSVVVIEGNYTDVKYRKIINIEDVDTFAITTTLPKGRMRGDIDGDGEILQSDINLLQDYLNNVETLDSIQQWCADVDANGQINSDDLTVLEQYISREENVLSSSHMDDYYNNWIYDYNKKAWSWSTSLADTNNIEDITGYNIFDYVINGSSVTVYCSEPPLEECPLWISYSSDIVYNGLNSLNANEQNRLFLANPSLLRMNDKTNYAFSYKLILYLLNSAITSQEDIFKNILRVQEAINIDQYHDAIPDVWDDFLRKVLFDSYINEYPSGLDILGYVDNDIEAYLLKRGAVK